MRSRPRASRDQAPHGMNPNAIEDALAQGAHPGQTYLFANRPICCAFPLPALAGIEPKPGTRPSIRVDAARGVARSRKPRQWRHQWHDGRRISLALALQPDGLLLRFPRLCDFVISADASRIGIESLKPLDADTLEHLLVDQVLPRCLAQRDALMLHAGAVEVDGRTLLFVGDTGAGKSTLAALLHREGHALLSDDCVEIDIVGNDATARGTYPSLRLYEDSASRILPTFPPGRRAAHYSDKSRLALPRTVGSTVGSRISAVYFLEPRSGAGAGVALAPKARADTCIGLMKNCFRLDPPDPSRAKELMHRLSAVATRVRGYSLTYPHDFHMASEVVAMVLRQCRALEMKEHRL